MADYSDSVTCPRCGKGNVPVDNETGRMATHRLPGDGVLPRPRCKASKRRPENARIPGPLRGREDLRLER